MQSTVQVASLAGALSFAAASIRSSSDKHEQSITALSRCGLSFERHRVRVLSAKECAYVRKGFTRGIKQHHMQLARRQLKHDIDLSCAHLPRRERTALYQMRREELDAMDLHHVIQIMTCPISLSPHHDWDQTLSWWRQEAHRRVVPIEKKLHRQLHAVQDRKIIDRFGSQATSQNRNSGAFIGTINIAVLAGPIWRPVQGDTDNSNVVAAAALRPSRRTTIWHPLDCHA